MDADSGTNRLGLSRRNLQDNIEDNPWLVTGVSFDMDQADTLSEGELRN